MRPRHVEAQIVGDSRGTVLHLFVLERTQVHGVITNAGLLAAILREPEFLAGGTDTGMVARVLAAEGDQVTAGQPLVVLEAMKMEHTVTAPVDGTVTVLPVDALADTVAVGHIIECGPQATGGHYSFPDEAKVGRAFSNVAQELALGGYAVYWPALVPARVVTQTVHLPDGTSQVVPHTPGEPTTSAPKASLALLLAPGVAVTTRPDAQAKCLGQYLRSRTVLVPEELARERS